MIWLKFKALIVCPEWGSSLARNNCRIANINGSIWHCIHKHVSLAGFGLAEAASQRRQPTGHVGMGKNAECCLRAVGGVNIACPLSNQLGGRPLIVFVCWKSLLLSFPPGLRLVSTALTICKAALLPFVSSACRTLFIFHLLLHPPIWEKDEDRFFQLGGSRWMCWLQAVALLFLPPLRSSCSLACTASGKREVVSNF